MEIQHFEDQLTIQEALRERNLLGKGQDLRANLTISGKRSAIDVSFTDPYFLDKDLSAGVVKRLGGR